MYKRSLCCNRQDTNSPTYRQNHYWFPLTSLWYSTTDHRHIFLPKSLIICFMSGIICRGGFRMYVQEFLENFSLCCYKLMP
jgi:hypothetical protein